MKQPAKSACSERSLVSIIEVLRGELVTREEAGLYDRDFYAWTRRQAAPKTFLLEPPFTLDQALSTAWNPGSDKQEDQA